MRFVYLTLFFVLIFGKVRLLQETLGFGGEVANIPPKLFLLVVIFGSTLKIFYRKTPFHLFTIEKVMLFIFGCFIICGYLGSFLFAYQPKIYPQLMDVINYSSFILGFYATIYFFQDFDEKKIKSWLSPCASVAKILTIVMLVFWLLEQTFGLGMTSRDVANRLLPPYQFIFYHGTYFMTVVTFLFIILFKERKIYILILCLLCLLSARDRGYFFLLLFLSFSFLAKYNIFNFKFLIPFIILIGISALAISYQKILYYTDEDSIRATFYIVAILLAIKHFPLGAGWCTIGTWNSYRYDSPIFDIYYNFFVWIEQRDTVYADSGFSSIIGQTGLLGTIFYLLFMLFLFFSMYKRFQHNTFLLRVISCWIIFNMVSYFVSDSMVSNFFITSSFFIGILYLQNKKVENKESDSSTENKISSHLQSS